LRPLRSVRFHCAAGSPPAGLSGILSRLNYKQRSARGICDGRQRHPKQSRRMNNSLRWKLILAFVLVFLAGAASGFFGAFHMHHFFARMDPGSMAQHMKQRLRAELKLTPEQTQQISPVIDRAASQLKTKREQTMRDVH